MRRFGNDGRDRPINVHELERAASVIVGAAFAIYALKGGISLRRAPAAVLGAALVHRGVTGYCPTYGVLSVNTASKADARTDPIVVEQSITIGRSPETLYALWREPDTLRRVMEGFAEVNPAADGETEWSVRLPFDQSVRYATRLTEERAPELLSWRSTAESPKLEGSLRLVPAPRDWGTEVTLRMSLETPFGRLGSALAKALGPVPKLFVQKALRRFKSLAETGEIPTLHHNPAARAGGRDE